MRPATPLFSEIEQERNYSAAAAAKHGWVALFPVDIPPMPTGPVEAGLRHESRLPVHEGGRPCRRCDHHRPSACQVPGHQADERDRSRGGTGVGFEAALCDPREGFPCGWRQLALPGLGRRRASSPRMDRAEPLSLSHHCLIGGTVGSLSRSQGCISGRDGARARSRERDAPCSRIGRWRSRISAARRAAKRHRFPGRGLLP